MECPKCHKTVGDSDAICHNCGLVLKDEPVNKKKKSMKSKLFGNAKPKSNKAELNPNVVKKHNGGEHTVKLVQNPKLKLTLICIVGFVIVILLVMALINIFGSSGSKTAMRLAEYIDQPLTDAEKDLEIHLSDASEYDGVNKAVRFDYIFEADDSVKVDEVKYPEWSVTALLDEDNHISSVTYTEYKVCEDNYKGIKVDKQISLDAYEKGSKMKTVLSEIDIDPYSITYLMFGKTYVFKYYYLTDAGDTQQVILSVTADEDDNLDYYSTTLVYPTNM